MSFTFNQFLVRYLMGSEEWKRGLIEGHLVRGNVTDVGSVVRDDGGVVFTAIRPFSIKFADYPTAHLRTGETLTIEPPELR